MSNTITVGFSNNGSSKHYVTENHNLANQLGILTVLGDAAVTDNVSGGILNDPYYVPETNYTIAGGGIVDALYYSGFTDESYQFIADGWNTVKNVSIVASGTESLYMKLESFVHTDVDFSGMEGRVFLVIYDAKRGNYTTGDNDDSLHFYTATNGSGWSNLHIVETGNGRDSIIVHGGSESLIGTSIVKYIDGRFTTFEADLGNGDDEFISLANTYTMDHVFGGDGNDTIVTQGGNDIIDGGNGNDILLGGSDNGQIVELSPGLYDVISTGDVFTGGAGDDTYYYQDGDDGFDHILDFEDNDIIAFISGNFEDVTMEVATLQTSSGDVSGLLLTVNDSTTIFLENYYNETEVFV